MNPRTPGAEIWNLAYGIADQIVERSDYSHDPRFRDFAPLAVEFLARTPAVVEAAARAWAHGHTSIDLGEFDDAGNDVGDERPFKVATLDAFEAIAAVMQSRGGTDTLETNLPPEQRPAWRDWHC